MRASNPTQTQHPTTRSQKLYRSKRPAKSLDLQHTIRPIRELDTENAEIEDQIRVIMDEFNSPITTIPGMGFRMAAVILAEVGDFA